MGDVVDFREKDVWKVCFVYYNLIFNQFCVNEFVYRMIYI